jgi:hypothetical protein
LNFNSVADSLAALKNKQEQFIRQVIGSKLLRTPNSTTLPEPAQRPIGRDSQASLARERVQPPAQRKIGFSFDAAMSASLTTQQ